MKICDRITHSWINDFPSCLEAWTHTQVVGVHLPSNSQSTSRDEDEKAVPDNSLLPVGSEKSKESKSVHFKIGMLCATNIKWTTERFPQWECQVGELWFESPPPLSLGPLNQLCTQKKNGIQVPSCKITCGHLKTLAYTISCAPFSLS